VEDIVVNIANPKECTKMIVIKGRRTEFSKVTEHKINIKKCISISYQGIHEN
jgi:hypothetical protein